MVYPLLQLGCNHVGDEGVKAIAIALLSNAQESQLVWLALGGNQITDRGAEHLAVALKLQHTTRENQLQGGNGEMGSRMNVPNCIPILIYAMDKSVIILIPPFCNHRSTKPVAILAGMWIPKLLSNKYRQTSTCFVHVIVTHKSHLKICENLASCPGYQAGCSPYHITVV